MHDNSPTDKPEVTREKVIQLIGQETAEAFLGVPDENGNFDLDTPIENGGEALMGQLGVSSEEILRRVLKESPEEER